MRSIRFSFEKPGSASVWDLKGKDKWMQERKKKKPFWDLKEKVKKGDVRMLICACECLAGSPAALNETAAEEFY